MDRRGQRLCSRCGAVVEQPELGRDGKAEGACLECGLGFSVAALYAHRPRTRLGRWLTRRSRKRQRDRDVHDMTAILRAPPFPVYGLGPSWAGRRWPGGSGASGDIVDRIGLGHGDPHDPHAPLVRVETLRGGSRAEAWAARGLAQVLWHEGAEHSHAIRAPFTSPDPTALWDELSLSVAGQRVLFRSLAAGPWWVALGKVGDFLVTVEARHVDAATVQLAVIEDPSPYLLDDGRPQGGRT